MQTISEVIRNIYWVFQENRTAEHVACWLKYCEKVYHQLRRIVVWLTVNHCHNGSNVCIVEGMSPAAPDLPSTSRTKLAHSTSAWQRSSHERRHVVTWVDCHDCEGHAVGWRTTQLFTGRMPFLSPNQQCQSTEGNLLLY